MSYHPDKRRSKYSSEPYKNINVGEIDSKQLDKSFHYSAMILKHQMQAPGCETLKLVV